MGKDMDTRNARAQMEAAKQQSERKFSTEQRLPRRFKIYDKIKDHVSLKTIDAIIIITALLIVGLFVYGVITGNPQQ